MDCPAVLIAYSHDRQTMARRWCVMVALATFAGLNICAQEPTPQDDVFFENAFEQALVGERPESLMPGRPGRGETGPDSLKEPSEDNAQPRWASLISASTLEDEIKSLNEVLIAAVRSPSHFAGGGNSTAADAFDLLASMLAVVDQYDGDVRWKHQAKSASHRFAEAAVKARGSEADSYAVARAAWEDLQELLGGSEIAEAPSDSRDESDVPDRAALMRRLEEATDERLGPWLANEQELRRMTTPIRHESEMIAAVAQLLTESGLPDADDEEYRGYAQSLRSAASELGLRTDQRDFRGSTRAMTLLRESCEQCHEGYR